MSADAVVDPRTEMSYFIVKASVPPDELKRLGDQKVQPGMQTDMFIITGERTFLGYLFQPLADSFNWAWRERASCARQFRLRLGEHLLAHPQPGLAAWDM